MEAADEAVLVLGAGAAGLATAAALKRRGVDALILERAQRAAASWHDRYDGLRLNTVRWMSDLPQRRMPRSCGRWPSRESWAQYLEGYCETLGLRMRFETTARRVDRAGAGFRVETDRGVICSRSVVVATGHDHTPVIPAWPGRETFPGPLLHASDYRDPTPFVGSDVLVVGSGNSACEIATLLATGGAGRVRIAIRTPPLILRREYLGLPATPFGIPARYIPDRVLDWLGREIQRLTFGDLSAHGLPRSPQRLSDMKRTYFSPPMDSGFVDAVKYGAIEVVAAVERIDGQCVVLTNGRTLNPDVVIAATGYRPALEPLVGHLGVLDDGEPVMRQRGVARDAPGLYFAGFRFDLLALLPHVERDANAIAKELTRGC